VDMWLRLRQLMDKAMTYMPLEGARAYLVKRGEQVDIKALVEATGARIVLTNDIDAVKPVMTHDEPMDRLAGLISDAD
jgi:hypothetical protein